jgi:hypothetical protein
MYYNSPYDFTRKLELLATLLLIALTLIEEPATIRFFPSQHHGLNHPQIWIAASIELLCVTAITGLVILRTRITGWAGWRRRRGNQFRLVILAMMVVDIVVGLASERYRHYRFLRLVSKETGRDCQRLGD